MSEDSYPQTVMTHEYDTLRSELLQNKKYVFERPLLIITAAGVAAVQLSGNPSVLLLPFLLIVMMLINLGFTVNRLRSMARIAAYIDVVLEGAPDTWIGWERSLRKHRMWTKQHSMEDRRTALSKNMKDEAIPDAMMFYGPLLLLHAVTVIVALSISFLTLAAKSQWPEIVSFGATLVVAIVFAYFWLGPYRPSQMRDLIEIQRATWINVIEIRNQIEDAEHAAAVGRPKRSPVSQPLEVSTLEGIPMPTLQNEYKMLIDELRQNRQIQLQAFLATPIWLSLFFGLVSAGQGSLGTAPALVLLPIPLFLLNLFLIANRRRSSDIIINYIRVAFDKRMAEHIGPGWHYRLVNFRHKLKEITDGHLGEPKMHQRFDFNMVVLTTYFVVSLFCAFVFHVLSPEQWELTSIITLLTVVSFVAFFVWNIRYSGKRRRLILAWENTFYEELNEHVKEQDI